ncbi:phytanoyl-CoA dioxygenase family protein [Roseisalinus antarcticus]|uniref:Phytanoyl-CoA dioxygenase (PhyH) n=1 Tax=Roseisalinus antarcticus TaxID=254357 RepID=A0A1Y5S334_9RHOB|nr:phytanoyl-CoA dioxygenase family protein [Roseisalinus antarcticus]SLN28937.1 Phytanoyl-CoA dioxygenase (PhyH) [Roseisalinus antarcticus]
MDTRSTIATRRDAVWLTPDSGDFETFRTLMAGAETPDLPLSDGQAQGIPLYDGARVRAAAPRIDDRRDLMAEWTSVLAEGPGIVIVKNAMSDLEALDRATEVFETLIAEEKAAGAGAGDHFAKPGANDRVWNAAEKHCLADPAGFARYYASDAIAMASEAWLGQGYQVTAQVNRVNPGGTAQTAHRDYHLGFMSPAQMAGFPSHVHGISPVLTLQGAVAHCDMSLESGPTLFLPHSQTFFEGYLAFSRLEFQAYFADHHVQVPLAKGDAVFFNPAVMHGAGTNSTADIRRLANLLQISSAFGRAMESLNRDAMCAALYPALLETMAQGTLTETELSNVIRASAEGYAFPTDLDRDPPVNGLAPQTQAELMQAMLAERQPTEKAREMLITQAARRKT